MFRLIVVAIALLGLSSPALAASKSSDFFDGFLSKSKASKVNLAKVTGTLQITVDITTQEMTVSDSRRTVYTFDVSTGRRP